MISKDEWAVIIDDNYQDIYRFVSRLLGEFNEAQDVTQETFLYAYSNWPKITDPLALRRWLFVTARNKCFDRFRLWRRMRERIAECFMQSAKARSFGEEQTDIAQCLKKLPRRQKEVFVLRHWHGFTSAEVAMILGINEGSVKSHLFRAIRRMNELLGDKVIY
ncbi:MAG: RNA polymerase sigma factor [Deltaproteobacteria bacterium]|nr:RNA polymerase sigma factor [Deltaproteobacteria bacterium]